MTSLEADDVCARLQEIGYAVIPDAVSPGLCDRALACITAFVAGDRCALAREQSSGPASIPGIS